jgi:hypothetical protein
MSVRRSASRTTGGALTLLLSAVTLLSAGTGTSAASTTSNPTAGTPASDAFAAACAMPESTPTGPQACVDAAVLDYDAVRQTEGVGPISLPTGFTTEPIPTQLFVISNIERVDRGLAPFTSLSPQLDKRAQTGANHDEDPTFAKPFPGTLGSSNWSGASGSALLDEYDWMYDDGPGGLTDKCVSAGDKECWLHRDGILGTPKQYAAKRLMGAAVAENTAKGTSMTEEFIGGDRKDSAGSVKWSQLAAKIPVGIAIDDIALAGASSGNLRIWASGRTMTVTASITGGGGQWSVSAKSFTLKAGHAKSLTIDHASSGSPATATLVLHDGHHAVNVSLSP